MAFIFDPGDCFHRYLSIQIDRQKPNLIDDMKARIDTHQGKKIYARRLGIVEPVFANICVQKHRTASLYVPNLKWIPGGDCLLWYTISILFGAL